MRKLAVMLVVMAFPGSVAAQKDLAKPEDLRRVVPAAPSRVATAAVSVLADWGLVPATLDLANGVVLSAPMMTQPRPGKWNGQELHKILRCGTAGGFMSATADVLVYEAPAQITVGFTATPGDSAGISRVTMMLTGTLTKNPPLTIHEPPTIHSCQARAKLAALMLDSLAARATR